MDSPQLSHLMWQLRSKAYNDFLKAHKLRSDIMPYPFAFAPPFLATPKFRSEKFHQWCKHDAIERRSNQAFMCLEFLGILREVWGKLFCITRFSADSYSALWELESVRSINSERLHGIGYYAAWHRILPQGWDPSPMIPPMCLLLFFVTTLLLPCYSKSERSPECIKKAMLHHNDYRHSHRAVVLSTSCSLAWVAYC